MSRARVRRWARRIAIAVLCVFMLPALAVLCLTFAPVRSVIMQRAVKVLQETLPGEFEVRRARWDWPARWEFNGIAWTREREQLLAAERVRVELRVPALAQRDLVVEQLRVENLSANVPAISSAFARADTLQRGAEAKGKPESQPNAAMGATNVPFLRHGALPLLPSVQIQKLSVDVSRAVLSVADTLTAVRLQASVDVLSGHAPRIDIAGLEGALPSQGIRLEPGSLTVDLQRGTIDAQLQGQVGHDAPFTLTSSSPHENAFDVVLLFPRHDVEARVHGEWHRRGTRPQALDFDADVRASDASALGHEALRRLSPAHAELDGRLELEDRLAGAATLALTIERPWFERTTASLRFDDTGFAAESLVVRLQGLVLRGNASIWDGSLRSELGARYDGSTWLEAVADSLTLPDSLRLQLELQAQGELSQPHVKLNAHGASRSGGMPIDSFSVQLEAPEGLRAQLRYSVALEAAAHRLMSTGTLRLPVDAEPLRVESQPILVRRLAPPPRTTRSRAAKSSTPGVVTYDTRTRQAAVRSLRILGDLGELTVTGAFEPGSGGRARATARWPEPPLRAALHDSTLAKLRAAWPPDPVPQIELEARVAGEAERFRTRVSGTLQLPGPERLAPLLPAGLDVSGWSEVRGRFRADVGDSISGDIDLGASSWVDTLQFDWSQIAGRTALENLQLRLEGVAIDGTLTLHEDKLAGRLTTRADRPSLLRRVEAWDDSIQVAWTGAAEVTGTRAAPRLEAQVAAEAASAAWSVPALRANLDVHRGQRAGLELTLPNGATMLQGRFRLDSVRVHYQSAASEDWLADGTLHLQVDGPEIGCRQSARVELGDQVSIHFDSLTLRLRDRELHSVRPFAFVQRAGERSYAINDLLLEGSMGRLSASCETSPEALALLLEGRLDVPAKPDWLQVPDAAWPTQLEIQARGSSHDDVHVSATLHGTQLSEKTDLRMDLELSPVVPAATPAAAATRGFKARVNLAGVDTLVAVSALLPVRFEQFPLRARTLEDSVHVRARWREIPFTWKMPEEGLAAFLDSEEPKPLLSGELLLAGRGVAPDVSFDARISYPTESMRDYTVTLRARGNGAARTQADLKVLHAKQSIAVGFVDVPLRFAFAPFRLELAPEDVSARIHAASLDLAKLAPVLPAGASAKGIVVANLEASGPAKNPQLRGDLRIDKLELELTGRRNAQLDFKSQLGGSLEAPEISGALRITQARMRIPERKSLLPTQGRPLLWDATGVDSLTITPVAEAPAAAPFRIPENAKVDLNIDVPSGFWILGDDLGVELKGDLDAGVENQNLVVHGRLEAVQGWFTLMGRNFELQRGRCDFDGLNAFNPTLNIEMRTKVKSTTIYVSITGDVEEPELKLRSEPDMAEGDILGVLVFGQPADQLGSGEGDFLAAQVTALAQSYSGAALQQVLGDKLGIDTVRFKSGTQDGSDDGRTSTSLEVGKYLTSSVLIQYEIDLQTGTGRGVTMEYRINERLRLDSHMATDRSGVEFNWSKDY